MELRPGSSTINTFLALDLMTLQPICIMMHIKFYFFTGKTVAESVRSFNDLQLMLFGLWFFCSLGLLDSCKHRYKFLSCIFAYLELFILQENCRTLFYLSFQARHPSSEKKSMLIMAMRDSSVIFAIHLALAIRHSRRYS